jgi:DNA-binding response OmpR family regulator
MDTVSILIIDDDAATQSALRQVLDVEGWHVHVAPLPGEALQQLASGDWKLVIANVALTGLSGPLYGTLRELALATAQEGAAMRIRVLFLVPELAAASAQPILESERLPYALKPFHFHDFLEKVSDLLMETQTITGPIRHVRQRRKTGPRGFGREAALGLGGARETQMFANREDYGMTEEEIAEFERQETEASQRKKKKKPDNSL